ncbi:hypothetical protein N7535_000330 [Penicillium sp. DV-2018c]|nr:hypothetical protein N7535_000330 [Penicillium sp. DV-2018c]
MPVSRCRIRETSALNNKLTDAETTIARQQIEKAGSKRKESATSPWISTKYFVISRENARYQYPQEIAELSLNFDFLETRYSEAKRALKEAEGNTIALFQWHGKYGRDVEEIGDTDLCGRHRYRRMGQHNRTPGKGKQVAWQGTPHGQAEAGTVWDAIYKGYNPIDSARFATC